MEDLEKLMFAGKFEQPSSDDFLNQQELFWDMERLQEGAEDEEALTTNGGYRVELWIKRMFVSLRKKKVSADGLHTWREGIMRSTTRNKDYLLTTPFAKGMVKTRRRSLLAAEFSEEARKKHLDAAMRCAGSDLHDDSKCQQWLDIKKWTQVKKDWES